MTTSIEIIKNMITEDVPLKDSAGIFIPRNEEVNIRNKVLRECLKVLSKDQKENIQI